MATLIMKLTIRNFTSSSVLKLVSVPLDADSSYWSQILLSQTITYFPYSESNAEKKTVLVGDGTFIGKHLMLCR